VRRIFIAGMVVLLSGCASLMSSLTEPPQYSQYSYVAQSKADPVIVFGGERDRYEFREFLVNIKDVVSNKCDDFIKTAFVGKNGFGGGEITKEISTPVGQAIAIRSEYYYMRKTCTPPVLMFTPQNGMHYSVDLLSDSDKCFLSVVQVDANGSKKQVTKLTKLPECVK
jgi:hypothetical protein